MYLLYIYIFFSYSAFIRYFAHNYFFFLLLYLDSKTVSFYLTEDDVYNGRRKVFFLKNNKYHISVKHVTSFLNH